MVVIALVLIVSRGLSNSGAIELLSRYLIAGSRKLGAHIGIMAGFAAVLSAVMNNVAALASADATGYAGRDEGETQPGPESYAAFFRLDPRWNDHTDRYTTQHRDSRIQGQRDGRALSHV